MAARRRWDLSDDLFQRLPGRMEQIANSDSRQAVAAAKVLLDMHAQNNSDGVAGGSGGEVHIYLPDNGRGQS